jgi:hypothetical protein
MSWELAIALAALALSVFSLWRVEQANRQAAVVLTWVDNEMVIENRGPASARDVGLSIDGRPEPGVPLLPAGFVHRVRFDRVLGQLPVCSLVWRDRRWRTQRLELKPTQQRTQPPGSSRPPLTDHQVDHVADRLAAGIAQGFKDYMASVARSLPRRGRWP